MLIETDMLVRQYMAYSSTLESPRSEFERLGCETIYDHMYYYYLIELQMTHETAEMHVRDFYNDAMAQMD